MYTDLILVFGMTAMIAAIIPGPTMLMALTHGMNHGVRKTTASAMGNVSVTVLQAAVSITGLGTILVASEAVFQVVKWAGAAYLIYMGIMVLRSPEMSVDNKQNENGENSVSFKKLFMQGALVTAGNPKAIIFFTAVFPQFIREEGSYMAQSSILIGICAITAFISCMIYAAGGQKILKVLVNATFKKFFKRALGSTFIGAGIALALSRK